MIYTNVAVLIAGIAIGGSTLWKVQEWRYESKEAQRYEQLLADQRLQATAALRREETIIDAQNKAQARARVLRLDAAAARNAADGLRVATAEALRDAAASHAACTERANTLGELLGTVEEAGRGMAEKAGLHANDVQTLTGSWPK